MNATQKAEFEEVWLANNINLVRATFNQQQNCVQNELREVFVKLFNDGEAADWPDKGTISNLP